MCKASLFFSDGSSIQLKYDSEDIDFSIEEVWNMWFATSESHGELILKEKIKGVLVTVRLKHERVMEIVKVQMGNQSLEIKDRKIENTLKKGAFK